DPCALKRAKLPEPFGVRHSRRVVTACPACGSVESTLFHPCNDDGDRMSSPFTARSRAIEPFHVMALLSRAHELEAAGHDVIHLEIGEPDFTTAEPIIAAGQAALAAGHTRYTSARGDRKSTRLNSSHVKISYAV